MGTDPIFRKMGSVPIFPRTSLYSGLMFASRAMRA